MYSGTLKERKKQEQEHEAKILNALVCRKKTLADAKREKRRKKKSVDELLPMLVLRGIRYDALRPAETYIPRSHNLDKQLTGLLNHLFVKYPVPSFLYQVCLSDGSDTMKGQGGIDDFSRAQEVYRRWFVTLAQGGSFPKAAKGIMTSREASVFLRASWAGRFMRTFGGPR